ncbi:MAG TPA: hypothetical protein VGN70_09145 [Gammaproteobacteria bacterium]|jgi:hypothetical protein
MTSKLGDPDIKVDRLDVWLHGRQFPDVQDYWDSDWLSVTAEYKGRDSRVVAHGPFIHLSELASFFTALKVLDEKLKGEAVLDCLEPDLHLDIRAKSLGHLEVEVSLTADNVTESHSYQEQIDQTPLPLILGALNQVLSRYPMRDPGKVVR